MRCHPSLRYHTTTQEHVSLHVGSRPGMLVPLSSSYTVVHACSGYFNRRHVPWGATCGSMYVLRASKAKGWALPVQGAAILDGPGYSRGLQHPVSCCTRFSFDVDGECCSIARCNVRETTSSSSTGLEFEVVSLYVPCPQPPFNMHIQCLTRHPHNPKKGFLGAPAHLQSVFSPK